MQAGEQAGRAGQAAQAGVHSTHATPTRGQQGEDHSAQGAPVPADVAPHGTPLQDAAGADGPRLLLLRLCRQEGRRAG